MKPRGLYLYWRSMKALFYGDNLPVFRDGIATESVGLINLDPPFNSNATYNVCFGAYSGRAGGLVGAGDNRQEETFSDRRTHLHCGILMPAGGSRRPHHNRTFEPAN